MTTTVTHQVPGTDLEITIRTWNLGSHGTRWGVAAYKTGTAKRDWRQIGSEHVFSTESDARAKANELWTTIKSRMVNQ